MKISTLSNLILLAPLAVCLAQTPKPAAPAPKPAQTAPTPTPAATPKSAMLEDIPGSDPVVITIGEEKITKSVFERLLAGLPDQAKARANAPGGKKQIADQVVQLKTMAQEARKRGLDKSAETRELIAFQTDSVLANALYRELAASVKTDDAAAKAYYTEHKAEYEEVTAKHILIRYKGSPVPVKAGGKDLTEEESLAKAQDIRKQLLAGADFGKLATAESDDTQSAQQAGSLGSFGKGRMVPAFEEAAFKQAPGQVSEPIKTQFGYHLILVEKHASKTFEEVKPGIEQKLKPELAQKAVEDVRKQATVTLNDAYFAK